MKEKELKKPRKGNREIKAEISEFNPQAHYAPEDVNTDAKRRASFLDGMCDELSIPLSVADEHTYQALLDQGIILESKMKKAESRKRKQGSDKYQPGSSHKKHNFHGGSGQNHQGHNHGGGSRSNNVAMQGHNQ